MNVILASASPRRVELLKQIGLDFTVQPSQIIEEEQADVIPGDWARVLAIAKANDVAEHYKEGIVIGADTIVVKDGEVLGKPKNDNHAMEMLQFLSGAWHEVITGVAIVDASGGIAPWDGLQVTRVKFRELNEEEIAAYIATGEPLDKAGAYGIQGFGALFVEKIEGCYFNVVGLPLHKLAEGLNIMGVNVYEFGRSKIHH